MGLLNTSLVPVADDPVEVLSDPVHGQAFHAHHAIFYNRLNVRDGLPDEVAAVDLIILNVGPEDRVGSRFLGGVADEKVNGHGVLEAGQERPSDPGPEVDRPHLTPGCEQAC